MMQIGNIIYICQASTQAGLIGGTDLGDNGAVLASRCTGRRFNRSRFVDRGGNRVRWPTTSPPRGVIFIASKVEPSCLVPTTKNDLALGFLPSRPLNRPVTTEREVCKHRFTGAHSVPLFPGDTCNAYLAATPVPAREYARSRGVRLL